MPEISLTDFVDFVAKSGTPKLTHVRRLKGRGEYSPAGDFWKRLRDGIIEFHKRETLNKSTLDSIAKGLTDSKKQNNYPRAIRQYKAFLGRKRITWFKPPSECWSHSGLDVRVNPELGLVINGKRHIVKLYFKGTPLVRNKAEMILLLMQQALPDTHAGDVFAVLDVQSKKLIASADPDPFLMPLLLGEAGALAAIWSSLP